jgi:hypothetical protein
VRNRICLSPRSELAHPAFYCADIVNRINFYSILPVIARHASAEAISPFCPCEEHSDEAISQGDSSLTLGTSFVIPTVGLALGLPRPDKSGLAMTDRDSQLYVESAFEQVSYIIEI